MSEHKQYSEEHLNAFIDNQLSTAEKAELLDDVRHDSELSQRICKLQKLKNLVQLSYESIDVPEHHLKKNQQPQVHRFKWITAASVLLALGSITGWLSHQAFNNDKLSDIAQLIQNNQGINHSKNWKVMLHVSTADPARLNIVLDEAEALLKEYASSSRNLELEILTNNKGLSLVSNNGNTFSKRLQAMRNKYNNLMVVACGETLKRIRANHKDFELLPKINIVPSALGQIVKRQKEGWTYIRI